MSRADFQSTTSISQRRRAMGAFGAGEADKMRAQRISRASTLALFLIIAVMLLSSLALGTNLYCSLVDERSEASELRLETSLLMNSIRANDETDSVAVGKGPEGQALVLVEHLSSGSYETRFYAYQGYIVQEYTVSGNPYTPERASQVAQSNSFDFEYEKGLLTIHTDTGSTSVALRSVREVA